MAAVEKPMVVILSHQIELPFQMAWQQVVTCIEDNTMDEAHGKLSWYHDQYNEVTKSIKSLEEKLSSERECCRKAETELESLCKEVKPGRKQKETPTSCEWHEWVSTSDSDTAE